MKAVLVALAAALVLTGCGGASQGADAPAAGATSSSPTSTASATPSTSSAPAVTREQAETAALAGLLPDSAMAKVDFTAKEKREAGSWEWYQSCTKILPSNSRIIGGASTKWGDGKRTIVQIVDVYPPGVAKEAVAEARKRTTCSGYTLGDGREVRGVKPFALKPGAGVASQYAWCESIKSVSRCHVVAAVGNTLTYLWVLSDPLTDTQDATAAFAKLAGARLVVQQK
jgi:hypothetical protein